MELAIPRKTFLRLCLITITIFGLLLAFKQNPNPKFIENTTAAALCETTQCSSGETLNVGCAIGGCPAGTYRLCECLPPGSTGFFWCWGNCQCISSASCSGGDSCTEGDTGGCGSNGCASNERSVCSGGSWSCYIDDSCSGGAQCGWEFIPTGCVEEGQIAQGWPDPGTCQGGDRSGQACTYNSDCADGSCDIFTECTCEIPDNRKCCQGLGFDPDGDNWACVCPEDSCNATRPSSFSLISPSNGSIQYTNDVILNWEDVSDWGTGCPQSNTYRTYFTQKNSTTCPAQGDASYSSKNAGGTSQTTLFDLEWGETYCWYAQARNGSRNRNSDETWEFSLPAAPELIDIQITTQGTCGNSISGNASIEGVDNPITVMTEYYLDDNGVGVEDIDQLLLAIIPDNVRNATIISEESAGTASDQYFMALVNINDTNPNQSEFQIVNSSSYPYYSSQATSGQITNTSEAATLLNINGPNPYNTRVEIIDANTLRVYWQIRFEDNFRFFDSITGQTTYTTVINNNLYTAGLRELIPGIWNSSAGDISRSLSREINWGVNVQIPQVQISSPNVIDEDSFEITWNANGIDVVTADGYMWFSEDGYQIRRTSPGIGRTFTLNSTEPEDFSPTNIRVGIGTAKELGTHRYEIIDTAEGVIESKMSIIDSACNTNTDTGPAMNLSGGWLMTVNGNAHASNFSTNIFQSQIEGELSYLNAFSYLSTYLSSVAENIISTQNRQSMNNFLVESYNDWNSTPGRNYATSSWYSYLLELAQQNGSVHNTSGNRIIANTTTEKYIEDNTGLTITDDSYEAHMIINDNFEIKYNTKCNTKSIFFVNGDINVYPNFTIENRNLSGSITDPGFGDPGVQGLQDTRLARSLRPPPTEDPITEDPPTIDILDPIGCIFVASGDIHFHSGDYQNGYDKVEAFFIADGNVYTYEDDGGDPDNLRYDGLYVKGGLVANQFLLGRDLKTLNNFREPAEIVEYDARYSIIFNDILNIKEYNIREKSYLINISR